MGEGPSHTEARGASLYRVILSSTDVDDIVLTPSLVRDHRGRGKT